MATNVAPKVLLTGAAAVSAAAKLMPSARPVTVNGSTGPVRLVPGTVWNGNRVLIDCSEMTVHYMVGTDLHEWATLPFVRDEMLSAIGKGAAQAEWLVHLAKLERDFLFGLFVPAFGMVGLTCARVLVVYANHRSAFAAVQKHLPGVISDLQVLKRENPTLFRKVFEKVGGEIITHLPQGISGEDVAFWAGRIIKGVSALGSITAAGIGKVLVVVTSLVGLLHSPGIAAHAAGAAIKQASLEAELKKLQIFISSTEAQHIVAEMKRATQSKAALLRLKTSLPAATPGIQEIVSAWKASA